MEGAMPNFCSYEMKVKGAKEKVEEFIKVIQSHYDYYKQIFDFDRHLYRVFEADTVEMEEEEEGVWSVIIYGDCAWSVYSCMMEGEHTYYNDNKDAHVIMLNGISQEIPSRGTSLIKESKNLGLVIEVYSEESGVGFQEHYIIDNGEVLVDKCVEYREYYWDKDEFPTIESFNKEYELDVQEDDFDGEYCTTGGFDEWYYSI